ncbi:probable UDP-3-O-acyl-N-acetylglucosamine deacetylase 1, mitochondrial isoform X2 [Solanum lycopersicum]|uniref:probable UDP-3-O-acyl-N-acetylglucosamine deacetylase 1, mitochondrial isoform X2 n=1 Tax=Solanum lycopersicum TaxID=4081 RepID=UPI00374A6221
MKLTFSLSKKALGFNFSKIPLMAVTRAFNINTARNSSSLISWIPTGKIQQTVANSVQLTGIGLHSGKLSTVTILRELAGVGRYFKFRSNVIPASTDYIKESALCTTLCKDGHSINTVEHLLSALEATGVDNCSMQIETSDTHDSSVEVPILDGSAREWVDAIEEAGLKAALDRSGNSCEKLAPVLREPVTVWKNDSFIAAFPYSEVKITYGIDFPQAPEIGCQWFSSTCLDKDFFAKELASARTFCIYEQNWTLGLTQPQELAQEVRIAKTIRRDQVTLSRLTWDSTPPGMPRTGHPELGQYKMEVQHGVHNELDGLDSNTMLDK